MTINEAIKTIIEQNRQLVKLFSNVNLDVENYDDTEVRGLIKQALDHSINLQNAVRILAGGSSNTSVSTYQTQLNALGNSYKNIVALATTVKTFIESTDTADDTINTWREIEQFLEGIKDDESLLAIVNDLNSKINEVDAKFDDYEVKGVDNESIINENGIIKINAGSIRNGDMNITATSETLSPVRTWFQYHSTQKAYIVNNTTYVYDGSRELNPNANNLITEKALALFYNSLNTTYKVKSVNTATKGGRTHTYGLRLDNNGQLDILVSIHTADSYTSDDALINRAYFNTTLENYQIKDVDGITLTKNDNGVIKLNYNQNFIGSPIYKANYDTGHSDPIRTKIYLNNNSVATITEGSYYNGSRDIDPEANNVVQEKALAKHLNEITDTYIVKDVDEISLVKDNNGVISVNVNNKYYASTVYDVITTNPVRVALFKDISATTLRGNINQYCYNGEREIDDTAWNIVQERALAKHINEMGNPRVFDLTVDNIAAIKEYYETNGCDNLFVRYTTDYGRIYVLKVVNYREDVNRLYTEAYCDLSHGISYYKIIDFNTNIITQGSVNLQGKNILDGTIPADKLVKGAIPNIKVFNVTPTSDNTELFEYVKVNGIENIIIDCLDNENNHRFLDIYKYDDTNNQLLLNNKLSKRNDGSFVVYNIKPNSCTNIVQYINANGIANNTITKQKLALEVADYIPDIKFFNVDSTSDNTELFNYVAEYGSEKVVIIYHHIDTNNVNPNIIYLCVVATASNTTIRCHAQLNTTGDYCYQVVITKNSAGIDRAYIATTALAAKCITLNRLADEVIEQLGGTIEDGSITKDKLALSLQTVIDNVNGSTVVTINDTAVLSVTNNGAGVTSGFNSIVRAAKNLKIKYGAAGNVYCSIKTIDLGDMGSGGVYIIAEKVDINSYETKYFRIFIKSSLSESTVTVINPTI